jgi:hypothetical protein
MKMIRQKKVPHANSSLQLLEREPMNTINNQGSVYTALPLGFYRNVYTPSNSKTQS